MQPFEVPEFYMPWPARLNPHVEAARIHSKAWAYEMGILGSEEEAKSSIIWDERTFDAHDYALLCAYTHPDVSEIELNLITKWYVWIFFFDDHFLENFKRSHNMEGAKEYLDRLPEFMPIDPTEVLPIPITPVECALENLWSITVFTKSIDWRVRFFESTKNQFDSSLCELANINQNYIANPIEYIELRRMVGGAPWSSALIEHAVSVEIPTEIVATRTMCVLKNSFSDAVHLHNDLFSYQREIENEGENSNCVLVLEHFFNINPQEAANLTRDLHTSRMQQFEHTAITELPFVFEEYRIDLESRLNVLLYIKGLQDFQSGSHEWHLRSSRYMNKNMNTSSTSILNLGIPRGLGTSAVKIESLYNTLGFRLKNYSYVPNRPVEQLKLPKFYMPFSSELNPHLESARKHSKQWVRQMGMFESFQPFTWTEDKFNAADVSLCAALIHPNASISELNLTADWLVWATYTDDYFLALYLNSRNMAGGKIFVNRLSAFMPIDSTSSISTPANSVERGLVDLWGRTVETLSSNARTIFRCTIVDMFESWLWELANHIQNRIPDPIDYIEMRRKTFGCDLTMTLSQLAQGEEIPTDIYKTQTLSNINNVLSDCAGLINDIFSYQKEIEFDGELHNGVLVIQSFLNCNLVEAVEIINNLITLRMHQFEHLITTEIPILFERFELNKKARQKLLDYVESLKHWIYGIFYWHVMSNRYKEVELKNEQARFKKSITIPTGLGTSAAQITALLKTEKTKDAISSIDPTLNEVNATGLGTSAARVIDLLKELK